MREDNLSLYGFLKVSELALFELLLSVSGIGPRVGLAIIDLGESGDIVTAIASRDIAFLTKVKGLGKKRAERLVLDLEQKIDSYNRLHELGQTTQVHRMNSQDEEALFALISLGYKKHEVEEMIRTAPDDANTAERKVAYVIKFIGQNI